VSTTWVSVLRAVHVAAGVAGCVAATVALAAYKGKTTHRRAGAVYLWAVGVVVTTGPLLALRAGFSPMFAMTMTLTAFLAFSGVRALRRRRLAVIPAADWGAAVAVLFTPPAILGATLAAGSLHEEADLSVAWQMAFLAWLFGGFDLVQFALWPRLRRETPRMWQADHLTKLTFSASIFLFFLASSRLGIDWIPIPLPTRVLAPLVTGITATLWATFRYSSSGPRWGRGPTGQRDPMDRANGRS
jgi:hypothetical protein